jgi:Predicted membrane protein
MTHSGKSQFQQLLGGFIFFSRWLQAPLYLGLIAAQAIYVYQFFVELVHLIEKVFLPEAAATGARVAMTLTGGLIVLTPEISPPGITEKDIMLAVLGLIDVVMIANLLIMVIVGGYETFVSRLRLEGHPDQPEWLSHVNAGVLKVKLATALIGISSIHLLKTFIEINGNTSVNTTAVICQAGVHLTFVISALLLAYTDRISTSTAIETRARGH